MPVQAKNGVAAKPRLNPAAYPCRDDPEAFFPDRGYTIAGCAAAKQMCRRCPARPACLTWVAEHPQPDGVYAAMTPDEREHIPDLLAAAGDAGRVLQLFDDREALATAHRLYAGGVTPREAVQIVGAGALERAQLVRRWAFELADKVMAGELSLREAAVQAQAVRDAGTVRRVAA